MFAALALAAALTTQLPPPNVRPPGMQAIPGVRPRAQTPMIEYFTPFGVKYERPAGLYNTLPANMAGLRQFQTRYDSAYTGDGGIPAHPGTHSKLVGSNGLSAMESMLIQKDSVGKFVGPPESAREGGK